MGRRSNGGPCFVPFLILWGSNSRTAVLICRAMRLCMVGRTQGAVPEHWNLWLSPGTLSPVLAGNRKLTPSVCLGVAG